MVTNHRRQAYGDQRFRQLAIWLGRPVAIGWSAAAQLAKFALPVAYLVLFAASYYLAVRLGLGFRFQNSQIGVVWPANALFLCALVLTPKSRWWIVLVAAALAHTAAVISAIPVWRMLWQIAGNTVFVVSTVEI